MTLADLGILVGIAAPLCVGAAWAVTAILKFHHNANVAPAITAVTTALQHNSAATTSLTAQLAITNATQREGQAETHRTFERMGEMLADHETRISLGEAWRAERERE